MRIVTSTDSIRPYVSSSPATRFAGDLDYVTGTTSNPEPGPLPPILIVEDNSNDLYLVRSRLDAGAVKNPVVAVSDAADAVALLERAIGNPVLHSLPEVMFTDLHPFRSNGLELIKWIRQQRALDGMKAIVLTGSSDPRHVRQANELGADDYLIKYPTPAVFARIIANSPAGLQASATLESNKSLPDRADRSIARRILVIEDNELLRDTLVCSLEHAAYIVSSAADGGEGLRLLRAEPADLVITDILMPRHGGLSTIIRLREEFPRTPIIAISGANLRSRQYLDVALKLGAARSIAKPFTPEAILLVVQEVLLEIAA